MLEKNSADVFWPAKTDIKKIGINTLWALISWIIWSVLVLILTTTLSWIIDVKANFLRSENSMTMDLMFPFLLSIVMFISSFIVVISSYLFLAYINPEKYRKNTIIFWQISFFSLLTYIFVTPLYLKAPNPDFLIYIFIIHSLLLFFGTSLLQELLNSYRYVLIWFYSSFVWLFVTTFISIAIFANLNNWNAKLILLALLFPIVNTSIVFFKWLFELAYYKYHKLTWYDQLWDIFYQIKVEEEEELREAEEESRIE